MPFNKNEFVRRVKVVNKHWKAHKSSLNAIDRIVNQFPASGIPTTNLVIQLQMAIWPTGDNPEWTKKKKKYRDALLYLIQEALGMPQAAAERVLLKKGDRKSGWALRSLPENRTFMQDTPMTNLTNLDPTYSTEFCYPDNGLWFKWLANEFVFCRPVTDDGVHKQKKLGNFGSGKTIFTVPVNTPYYSSYELTTDEDAKKRQVGEIAFYNKLVFTSSGVVTVMAAF